MRTLTNGLLAIVLGVLGFLATLPALAQALPDPQVPANLFARLLVDVVGGHWLMAIGLVIATILAVAASHFSGITRVWGWLTTDAGATAWTFLVSALVAVATSLSIGAPLSLGTLHAAVAVGVAAIGGYHGARKFLGPSGIGRWFPWVDKLADALGPDQAQLTRTPS